MTQQKDHHYLNKMIPIKEDNNEQSLIINALWVNSTNNTNINITIARDHHHRFKDTANQNYSSPLSSYTNLLTTTSTTSALGFARNVISKTTTTALDKTRLAGSIN